MLENRSMFASAATKATLMLYTAFVLRHASRDINKSEYDIGISHTVFGTDQLCDSSLPSQITISFDISQPNPTFHRFQLECQPTAHAPDRITLPDPACPNFTHNFRGFTQLFKPNCGKFLTRKQIYTQKMCLLHKFCVLRQIEGTRFARIR